MGKGSGEGLGIGFARVVEILPGMGDKGGRVVECCLAVHPEGERILHRSSNCLR